MSRRFRLLGRLFDRRTWFLSSSFLAQMRLFRIILMSVLLAGTVPRGYAAEPGVVSGEAVLSGEAAAAPEKHQMSTKADTIGHIGSFPITNSMLVTWMV